MDEVTKFLQEINWINVLLAAFFGTLGFIGKSMVDLFRERTIKKTEAELERKKVQLEQKQTFILETVRIFLVLDELTRRFIDMLNHIHRLVSKSEENIWYQQYINDSLCYDTMRFVGQLEKIYQVETQIVLSERELKILSEIRSDFTQYLSDQGVFREYQFQLGSLLYNNPEFGFKQIRESGSVSPEAIASIQNWARVFIAELKSAYVDSTTDHTRDYPTLEQWGIQLREYNVDISGLRLPNEHVPFFSAISGYFKLSIKQDLLRTFRKDNSFWTLEPPPWKML